LIRKFYVAPESYGADSVEDGWMTYAEDEKQAAETCLDVHFAEFDYEDEAKVFVREFGKSTVSKWTVYAHRSYTFNAISTEPRQTQASVAESPGTSPGGSM
jgi:hypothetical protein